MKRHKSKILLLIVYLVACICSFTALADEYANTGADVIYVLDVSASMRKAGLFENIKSRLKELVGERHVGDRVVLITFGEDASKILDVEVRSSQDLEDIKQVIAALRAEGPWTWMSKAFQKTRDMAEDIKSKSPRKRITIYLLTDCENDPPPAVRRSEPTLKFVEVLTRYFKDFKVEGAHVYLLSYGHLGQDEKDAISRETAVDVKEPQASEPIPARIILDLSGFDFGNISVSKNEVMRSGIIIIKKIERSRPAEKVRLSAPPPYGVNPDIIGQLQEGQKHKITIAIPAGLDAGRHSEAIKLSASDALVEPSQIDFAFMVGTFSSENIWKWLLFLGLSATILSFVVWFMRRQPKTKRLWVRAEGGRPYDTSLSGKQKVWLSEHPPDESLNLGLSTYFVTIENGSVMLCEERSGNKKTVDFTNDMKCELEEGRSVNIRFYDFDPRIESGNETGGNEDRPPKGPMGEI